MVGVNDESLPLLFSRRSDDPSCCAGRLLTENLIHERGIKKLPPPELVRI